MPASTKLPLYVVATPYGDEADSQPTTMDSAKSYRASLDAHGIPCKIVYHSTVNHNER